MAVYEGNEKYIFVSYAHKDTHIVLPIIEELQKKGFRVWYDGGIEAGTEWPEYIADHLERCAVALLFISDNALASRNCTREINFAISVGCDMLAIYLSDVKLSSGMKMQLGTIQALFRNRFIDDESFTAAIVNAKLLKECREGYQYEGDEEMQSTPDSDDSLDAFFGAEKQKKKSMQKTLDEYTMTLPIKAYNGVVDDETRCTVLDNARQIDEVLSFSKIKALVCSIVIGPRVTTYYINAERGVRFSQLEGAVDEIKFSLSVSEVRIIPPSGASRPGFEILNANQQVVTLEGLLKEANLRERMNIEARTDTSVPLGRNTLGDAVFADIARFPHLLIGGITQTGKSTLLHSMIATMITRVPKERLRLILVDLKGVEFNIYDKEPHMLLPIIHNSAEAARALTWLCDEMENRYKQMQVANVRNIDAYNELPENQGNLMPRLLLIVDDYTDLVYNYQK
ncbi:MAG: TIR domain-containing protein, partial [Clostridia bacterium]|nr:TIR domain-containing protein [Clostridia bacterium]